MNSSRALPYLIRGAVTPACTVACSPGARSPGRAVARWFVSSVTSRPSRSVQRYDSTHSVARQARPVVLVRVTSVESVWPGRIRPGMAGTV